jgi:hypothetical protein
MPHMLVCLCMSAATLRPVSSHRSRRYLLVGRVSACVTLPGSYQKLYPKQGGWPAGR